ncbi:MAG: hypothetical protein WCX65_02865 [bacterium]
MAQSLMYRVRNAPIVVNVEKSNVISMLSISFAPPGSKTIFRNVVIKNESSQIIRDLSLAVNVAAVKELAKVFQKNKLVQIVNGKRMAVGILDNRGVAKDGRIVAPIGVLAPGQEASFVLYVDFQRESVPFTPPNIKSANIKSLLVKTRDSWNNWLKDAIDVSASDPRLAGLFENTLTLIKTQTAGTTGAVAPMGKYSGSWCRDSFGPVRFLLAAGKFADVRRILRFYDLATRLKGFNNRYEVDVNLDSAPKKVDWNRMTPQRGDDPSLLILQYYFYYRATGDAKFIGEHYDFIRRNLTGQDHGGDFRLPFNGDETYQVYFLMTEGRPLKEFFSAESGFLHTAAARALSVMAAAVGETEDSEKFARIADSARSKTEELYWDASRGLYIPGKRKDTLAPAMAPFADINFDPIWVEYALPGDANLRNNAINSAKKLITPEGTVRSSSRTGLYTGLAPGMLLYNLKSVGAIPQADREYSGMMNRMLSRTGEFAEAYDAQDNWVNYGSAPTVYRPWESGVNAEAILYYITGAKYERGADTVTLQPHLPPGVDWIKFKNLYVGPYPIALSLTRRKDNTIAIDIENFGSQKVNIKLLTEPIPQKDPPETPVKAEPAAQPATPSLPFSVTVDGMVVGKIDSAAYARPLISRKGVLQPGAAFHVVGAEISSQ